MACSYYCWKGGLFGGDYWCKKTDTRVDDNTYQKYCKNYNYDECPVYKHNESSGCFITTVTCEILGRQDDSVVMNDLRKFRDEVLHSDEKYNDILKEYDVIGPILADCIKIDPQREIMADGLYNNALVPIHELVNNKEYDKAVEKYYLMTLMLIKYYGLKHIYNSVKDDDYGYKSFDPSVSGHGRKLERKI